MNSQTKNGWKIRWQFAEELFECVWPFVGLALKGLRLLLFVEIKTFLNLITKLAPLCKHFTLWRMNYYLHQFTVKDCDNFKGLQRNTYTAQKWFMSKVYVIFAILSFSSLKESTFETEKNDFYFTSKSLFVPKSFKF